MFVSLAAVSLGENMWWPTSTRSGGVWCRSAGRKKGSADLGLRTFGTPRHCRQPPQHRSGGRGGGPGGRGGGRGGGRRGRGGGQGGGRGGGPGGEPSTIPLERICLRQLGILQPDISYFRTENSYTSPNYEIRRKWAGQPNT